MTNCDMKVEGNILTLTVDLSQRHGDSGSTKTIIVATSSGNQRIPGQSNPKLRIGLNVYEKKDKPAEVAK